MYFLFIQNFVLLLHGLLIRDDQFTTKLIYKEEVREQALRSYSNLVQTKVLIPAKIIWKDKINTAMTASVCNRNTVLVSPYSLKGKCCCCRC